MADFSQAVVTNAGVAADATALANGWTLQITRVQIGQGILGATDPKTLTNLISPVNLVSPAPTPPNANLIGINNLTTYQVSVRFEVSSAWVATQFNLTEAGLWAKLNAGTEFLYAYAYAIAPDTITSSASSSPVDNQYTCVIPYATSPTITVVLGVYPTVNLHAATHLDNGTDPIPVSTTSRTGSLPILSGNVNDVLHGNGTWSAGFLPGMSMNYRGSSAPSGWLVEDGSAVSRATYAPLFAVIATIYGVGDGSTTFNLPDSRGRMNIGSGTGPGLSARTLAQKAGAETFALAIANMPSHGHGVTDFGHNHALQDPSHSHPVNDPSHAHSIADPGHLHNYIEAGSGHVHPLNSYPGTGPTGSGQNTLLWTQTPQLTTYFAKAGGSIDRQGTGIGIYGAFTGVYLSASITGCFNSPSGTGISIQAAGSGAAFNMMNPFIVSLKIIKT